MHTAASPENTEPNSNGAAPDALRHFLLPFLPTNTGAHESKERTRAPLATNLISHAHAVEDAREWCYILPPGAPPPAQGAASDETQWGTQVCCSFSSLGT